MTKIKPPERRQNQPTISGTRNPIRIEPENLILNLGFSHSARPKSSSPLMKEKSLHTQKQGSVLMDIYSIEIFCIRGRVLHAPLRELKYRCGFDTER